MITINNLSFNYGKRKPVFRHLNLKLSAGNVYGLLGKNGAGKSSLLRNMAGLLFPSEGTCTVNGYNAQDRLPSFLQEMYFLPEEFYAPPVKIKDFVKTYSPFYPNFSLKQFLEYLEEFQISENEKLTELSLGQKKKALIGFGLATNTKVLIMDEPTNGLDIPSKSQFRKIIASVATDERIIVISTHQVRDLDSLIDPIIILDGSEVLLHATTEEIAEKLSFKTVSVVTDHEKVLYSEHSIRGFSIVMPNNGHENNKVDLELLFNAALTNRQAIKDIFQ
ncbi:ABC transporter ATP-binding protein [Arcicella sp. DC2W]|uniref:ABC transporter ATP-binding protein n=1 Tax=Arcicella gelida TaxID=2984195 RepID=A0ABU5S5L5_9BACT|nr:ABC transporter ATP-binding protein [Arcicella sp. DC2W]MEA5403745.1 ABC transporter ATP-binding protein [Arcicella sp. DC2W]